MQYSTPWVIPLPAPEHQSDLHTTILKHNIPDATRDILPLLPRAPSSALFPSQIFEQPDRIAQSNLYDRIVFNFNGEYALNNNIDETDTERPPSNRFASPNPLMNIMAMNDINNAPHSLQYTDPVITEHQYNILTGTVGATIKDSTKHTHNTQLVPDHYYLPATRWNKNIPVPDDFPGFVHHPKEGSTHSTKGPLNRPAEIMRLIPPPPLSAQSTLVWFRGLQYLTVFTSKALYFYPIPSSRQNVDCKSPQKTPHGAPIVVHPPIPHHAKIISATAFNGGVDGRLIIALGIQKVIGSSANSLPTVTSSNAPATTSTPMVNTPAPPLPANTLDGQAAFSLSAPTPTPAAPTHPTGLAHRDDYLPATRNYLYIFGQKALVNSPLNIVFADSHVLNLRYTPLQIYTTTLTSPIIKKHKTTPSPHTSEPQRPPQITGESNSNLDPSNPLWSSDANRAQALQQHLLKQELQQRIDLMTDLFSPTNIHTMLQALVTSSPLIHTDILVCGDDSIVHCYRQDNNTAVYQLNPADPTYHAKLSGLGANNLPAVPFYMKVSHLSTHDITNQLSYAFAEPPIIDQVPNGPQSLDPRCAPPATHLIYDTVCGIMQNEATTPYGEGNSNLPPRSLFAQKLAENPEIDLANMGVVVAHTGVYLHTYSVDLYVDTATVSEVALPLGTTVGSSSTPASSKHSHHSANANSVNVENTQKPSILKESGHSSSSGIKVTPRKSSRHSSSHTSLTPHGSNRNYHKHESNSNANGDNNPLSRTHGSPRELGDSSANSHKTLGASSPPPAPRKHSPPPSSQTSSASSRAPRSSGLDKHDSKSSRSSSSSKSSGREKSDKKEKVSQSLRGDRATSSSSNKYPASKDSSYKDRKGKVDKETHSSTFSHSHSSELRKKSLLFDAHPRLSEKLSLKVPTRGDSDSSGGDDDGENMVSNPRLSDDDGHDVGTDFTRVGETGGLFDTTIGVAPKLTTTASNTITTLAQTTPIPTTVPVTAIPIPADEHSLSEFTVINTDRNGRHYRRKLAPRFARKFYIPPHFLTIFHANIATSKLDDDAKDAEKLKLKKSIHEISTPLRFTVNHHFVVYIDPMTQKLQSAISPIFYQDLLVTARDIMHKLHIANIIFFPFDNFNRLKGVTHGRKIIVPIDFLDKIKLDERLSSTSNTISDHQTSHTPLVLLQSKQRRNLLDIYENPEDTIIGSSKDNFDTLTTPLQSTLTSLYQDTTSMPKTSTPPSISTPATPTQPSLLSIFSPPSPHPSQKQLYVAPVPVTGQHSSLMSITAETSEISAMAATAAASIQIELNKIITLNPFLYTNLPTSNYCPIPNIIGAQSDDDEIISYFNQHRNLTHTPNNTPILPYIPMYLYSEVPYEAHPLPVLINTPAPVTSLSISLFITNAVNHENNQASVGSPQDMVNSWLSVLAGTSNGFIRMELRSNPYPDYMLDSFASEENSHMNNQCNTGSNFSVSNHCKHQHKKIWDNYTTTLEVPCFTPILHLPLPLATATPTTLLPHLTSPPTPNTSPFPLQFDALLNINTLPAHSPSAPTPTLPIPPLNMLIDPISTTTPTVLSPSHSFALPSNSTSCSTSTTPPIYTTSLFPSTSGGSHQLPPINPDDPPLISMLDDIARMNSLITNTGTVIPPLIASSVPPVSMTDSTGLSSNILPSSNINSLSNSPHHALFLQQQQQQQQQRLQSSAITSTTPIPILPSLLASNISQINPITLPTPESFALPANINAVSLIQPITAGSTTNTTTSTKSRNVALYSGTLTVPQASLDLNNTMVIPTPNTLSLSHTMGLVHGDNKPSTMVLSPPLLSPLISVSPSLSTSPSTTTSTITSALVPPQPPTPMAQPSSLPQLSQFTPLLPAMDPMALISPRIQHKPLKTSRKQPQVSHSLSMATQPTTVTLKKFVFPTALSSIFVMMQDWSSFVEKLVNGGKSDTMEDSSQDYRVNEKSTTLVEKKSRIRRRGFIVQCKVDGIVTEISPFISQPNHDSLIDDLDDNCYHSLVSTMVDPLILYPQLTSTFPYLNHAIPSTNFKNAKQVKKNGIFNVIATTSSECVEFLDITTNLLNVSRLVITPSIIRNVMLRSATLQNTINTNNNKLIQLADISDIRNIMESHWYQEQSSELFISTTIISKPKMSEFPEVLAVIATRNGSVMIFQQFTSSRHITEATRKLHSSSTSTITNSPDNITYHNVLTLLYKNNHNSLSQVLPGQNNPTFSSNDILRKVPFICTRVLAVNSPIFNINTVQTNGSCILYVTSGKGIVTFKLF